MRRSPSPSPSHAGNAPPVARPGDAEADAQRDADTAALARPPALSDPAPVPLASAAAVVRDVHARPEADARRRLSGSAQQLHVPHLVPHLRSCARWAGASIAASSRGTLEFLRPSFNEPWDPGPPTADLFEAAPVHPHTSPREFVPTPEPTGNLPPDDRERHRARRVRLPRDARRDRGRPDSSLARSRAAIPTVTAYARSTWTQRRSNCRRSWRPTNSSIRDRGGHFYPMLFTVTLAWMHDMPIVTHIHGTPTYEKDAEYLGQDATRGLRLQRRHVPVHAAGLVFRPALVRPAHRRRPQLASVTRGG